MESNTFGNCHFCGAQLKPIQFWEYERDKDNSITGRKRLAVSHLECPHCGSRYVIDDSFDGQWQ